MSIILIVKILQTSELLTLLNEHQLLYVLRRDFNNAVKGERIGADILIVENDKLGDINVLVTTELELLDDVLLSNGTLFVIVEVFSPHWQVLEF